VSLLSARAAGAEPIVITDLFQSRLDFAKKLVPGVRTVLIERGSTPKESAHKIKAVAECAMKVAIECSGVESSIHTAVHVRNTLKYILSTVWLTLYATQATQFGGKVFIIGVGKNEQVVRKWPIFFTHSSS
jgi:L-iditol 2-dehydrogenase